MVVSLHTYGIKRFSNSLKLLPIILIFLMHDISAQQVVVNLQAPPPYQMRIEDMWNLVLINQGEPTEVYLHGIATEQNSGLVTDVSTSVFYLPRGSKRIRSVDVGTITVNQSNQNYNSVINRLSAVPNGNYEICISVIRASDGFILGTGCIQHEVLNLSQVELLYPENNAVLNPFEDEKEYSTSTKRGIEKKDIRRGMVNTHTEEQTNKIGVNEPGVNQIGVNEPGVNRIGVNEHLKGKGETEDETTGIQLLKGFSNSVVFSWLPPTPVPTNVRVTYRLKIVELFGNQSPYDAMLSNPMFFLLQVLSLLVSNILLQPVNLIPNEIMRGRLKHMLVKYY